MITYEYMNIYMSTYIIFNSLVTFEKNVQFFWNIHLSNTIKMITNAPIEAGEVRLEIITD